MTTMYDSTTAGDIPADAAAVAGYKVGGHYTWSDADWARFATDLKVELVTSAVNDGDDLDVENGDATNEQIAQWVEKRQASGVARPWIYVNHANWQAAREAAGSLLVGWHVADWTGEPHELTLEDGTKADAVQYANPTTSGGHFDLSEIYGTIPSKYVAPVPGAGGDPAQPPTDQPGELEVSTLPTLSEGSSGDAVKSVQALLNSKGGANLAEDSQFGPQTKTKVEDWQKIFELTVDGIVGPQTWSSLLLL